MEKISSPYSYTNRVFVPLLFAMFFVGFTILALSKLYLGESTLFAKMLGTGFLLGMIALPYFVLRRMVLRVMDEVYVDSSSFVVKRGKHQALIPFEQVSNISYVNAMTPAKAILNLRAPCIFGRHIEFLIVKQGLLDDHNDVLDRVIDKVDEAKRKSSAAVSDSEVSDF